MAFCTIFCRTFCSPCAIACALTCGALAGQTPGLIQMVLGDSMGVDDGAGTVVVNGDTILIVMSDSVGATG